MKTISSKKLESLKDKNKLNNYVIDCILSEDKENRINYIENILKYGCASGVVSDLIYYDDTCNFYKLFINEINDLLKESVLNISSNLYDIFGKKYDINDPLNLETNNQNLLAWFGFEETLRNIAYILGLEV